VKAKKLLDAVEEGTQSAVEYLTPYVEQALRDSGELADTTYSKIRPAIKDATIRGARLASDTFEKVHPVLDDAIDKVSPAVDATVKRVRPAVEDVLDRIPPTLDYARGKVQDELLPGLSDQLRHLAKQPLAKELQVAVASAALADKLDAATGRKKHGFWRTLGKLMLAGAILGGVVYAVKKLLADPSSGWESYTPRDNAYVADPVKDVADKAADVADKAADVASDVTAKASDIASKVAEAAGDAAENLTEAASNAAEAVEHKAEAAAEAAEGGDADPFADSPYGEGSYSGDEPPEGFTVKGNDRSKKYHVPGSASYERTSAEVWFASAEAAEAAGFTRAQR
jgi:gas vesicle protein